MDEETILILGLSIALMVVFFTLMIVLGKLASKQAIDEEKQERCKGYNPNIPDYTPPPPPRKDK